MRNTLSVSLVFLLALTVSAQEAFQPLATMAGRSFTAQDLPNEVGNAWQKLPATLKQAKKSLLELQIDELLLRNEAKKLEITKEQLEQKEITAKTPEPTEKEITTAYEQNKRSIGFAPLSEVREAIVRFLKNEKRNGVRKTFLSGLRSKANISYPTSLEKPKIMLAEKVAVVNATAITYAEFRLRNALTLYEYEANVFDQVDRSLRMLVDSAVYQEEARARGIPVNELVQAEVSSKMTKFTQAEQEELENTLKSKLYKKFRVKYFIKAPKIYTQNVSADDDPILGTKNAPVTMVVFADFECPTCAGVNPVVKSLVQKYKGQVRLVYRDFPLERVHKHALPAAKAAYAAHRQGKFYAYSDLLYKNQKSLDRLSLIKYAEQLGLDKTKFVADMDSPATEKEIRKDISDGERYGVAGTPSIFVNGYKVRRLASSAIENAIKKAIAKEF